MTNNYNALAAKISGLLIGMALFFSLGIAMSYASTSAPQQTWSDVIKKFNVAGIVSVCQVRRCV
jgi:CHASE3 domain sensor protein